MSNRDYIFCGDPKHPADTAEHEALHREERATRERLAREWQWNTAPYLDRAFAQLHCPPECAEPWAGEHRHREPYGRVEIADGVGYDVPAVDPWPEPMTSDMGLRPGPASRGVTHGALRRIKRLHAAERLMDEPHMTTGKGGAS